MAMPMMNTTVNSDSSPIQLPNNNSSTLSTP